MNELNDSILLSIKQDIGATEEYKVFDPNIIRTINSALWRLQTLGIGVQGFSIKDEDSKWSDFLGENENKLESVKTYVYLKTRLVFDPPGNSFLVNAIETQIKELEWVLNICVDPPYEYE